MNFTHLHMHTEYSLLDGSSKISELIGRIKELGMDSVAITDHGVMYGVIDFYKAARDQGIKPVIGCEVYVAPGSRWDRESSAGEDRYNHLVLLAENNTGYANLMKLVSKGFTEGFYYKPRVDHEILREYHEGIIALSACLAGTVASCLCRGQYELARDEAIRLRDIFGENNFFLELQDHGIPEQRTVNQGLLRMHADTGIPLVCTNDCHYIYPSDAEAHDILLCIQTQKKLNDEDRMRYDGGQYYVKSPEEMAQLFAYAPEAVANTHAIAERCNVEIEFGHYKLPVYDVPDGLTAWEYLNKLCKEGLARRYSPVTDELLERMEYELATIRNMGFIDYFLIVWDFINYAKSNGIAVGPGRGSAAGSIVAYSLGITDIDPIRYQLLFERFLNPERVTMPDIDVDFCVDRRQEVIEYVARKYGKEKVAQIVTFGTLAAKGVIRDVGRVMDIPYSRVDAIAKMVPNDPKITIDIALKSNSEFRALYESDDEVHKLIDMSKRLEGLPRHTSMHAAGVVISNRAVEDYVPLAKGSDDAIVTQYTMTTLEELGLLKMDFLGLRNLTVIQNAVRLINNGSANGEFDIDKIDFNDKKIYEMISAGKTEGVFQLESTGMTNFMKELKPENIEDVIAGIALFRPGPMDFIPKYIEGKNHADSITYDCPELEHILDSTHGCIVYQEQVMQIVRDLAGYSYGRSDLVRRAMSKKKVAVMEKERQNFVYGNKEEGVKGCIANGISAEVANHIYDEMTDFAKYAFNKSHAAAYAVVAYQTAFLRYYYPKEYFAALLSSVVSNTAKISEYIQTCRSLGIRILPPDINEGFADFSASNEGIRYGMCAIKGLGRPVIDAIVEERNKNGRFTTLQDLAERMSGKEVNKRTVESFIKAGALDSLPATRREKMAVYGMILDSVAQEKKKEFEGQMSLFDFAPSQEKEAFAYQIPKAGEYDKEQLLSLEKEVLGVYLSGHPLDSYASLLDKNATARSCDFINNAVDEGAMSSMQGFEQNSLTDGQVVVVGGIIEAVTTKMTKSGSVMAFISLTDLYGTMEILVFPKDYDRNRRFIKAEQKVFIKGRVSAEEEKDSKLICQEIIPFEEVPRELWVQYADKEAFLRDEEELYKILAGSPGSNTVCIYCTAEKAIKKLSQEHSVTADRVLLLDLLKKYGDSNVKIVEKSIEKIVQKH